MWIVGEKKKTGALIGVAEIAEMLGVAERTVRRLKDTGKTPAPITLGMRMLRWRHEEIDAWIAAGCPTRGDWESMRGGSAKA